MLIHLESFISSQEIFISHELSLSLYMAVILASSTPITEEHTKPLDCLSEPSSQLIHHISHPLKEDVSAKVINLCFICIQVHSFASCIPTFCKRDLSVTTTAKQPSWKYTLFKHSTQAVTFCICESKLICNHFSHS